MQGPHLPPPDEPMTVDVFLHRWPTAAIKAELIAGVLLFEGTFTEEDAEIARRAYPGRHVLLNADGGLEVHPRTAGGPQSLLDR